MINVREQDVRERIAHITGGRLRPPGLIGMPNPSVTIPLDPLTVGGSFAALPFGRLVRFYDFDEINQAVADVKSSAVIKPVLRIA